MLSLLSGGAFHIRLDQQIVPFVDPKEFIQDHSPDDDLTANFQDGQLFPVNQLPDGIPADARVIRRFLDGQSSLVANIASLPSCKYSICNFAKRL